MKRLPRVRICEQPKQEAAMQLPVQAHIEFASLLLRRAKGELTLASAPRVTDHAKRLHSMSAAYSASRAVAVLAGASTSEENGATLFCRLLDAIPDGDLKTDGENVGLLPGPLSGQPMIGRGPEPRAAALRIVGAAIDWARPYQLWLCMPETQQKLADAEAWMRQNPPSETNLEELEARFLGGA